MAITQTILTIICLFLLAIFLFDRTGCYFADHHRVGWFDRR